MPRDEARDYAQRLKVALKRSPKPIATAAELAREFSLRHQQESITPQAAQKWLTGKAKPRYEKSVTLATWLGVSPEWLHYGEVGRPTQNDEQVVLDNIKLTEPEALLIARLRLLSRHQQELLAAIVEEFASVNRQIGQAQPTSPNQE